MFPREQWISDNLVILEEKINYRNIYSMLIIAFEIKMNMPNVYK